MLRRSGILIVASQVAPIKPAKRKEVLWKKNGRRDRDGDEHRSARELRWVCLGTAAAFAFVPSGLFTLLPKFLAGAQRGLQSYLYHRLSGTWIFIKTVSWNNCPDHAESDQLHSSLALAPCPRRLFVFKLSSQGSRKSAQS